MQNDTLGEFGSFAVLRRCNKAVTQSSRNYFSNFIAIIESYPLCYIRVIIIIYNNYFIK